MEKIDDAHFRASAKLKLGLVRTKFKAHIALENPFPPHRVSLKAEGSGGVAGFAKGHAEITLTLESGGTMFAYRASANIGGKLAKIGQRLIDGMAKQIADRFFARFSEAVIMNTIGNAGPPAEPFLDTAAAPLQLPPEDVPAPVVATGKREGVAPEIWVVGLIAVIVILLMLFSVAL